MNELVQRFTAACQARGGRLSYFLPFNLNSRLTFAGSQSVLLDPLANTFYWVGPLTIMTVVAQATAPVVFRLNAGGIGWAGAANIDIVTPSAINTVFNVAPFECDSLAYVVNGNTAGSIVLIGQCYGVEYVV